jgi:hypothetical protein
MSARVRMAGERRDLDGNVLLIGQSAGVIEPIEPAAEIVSRLACRAESDPRVSGPPPSPANQLEPE